MKTAAELHREALRAIDEAQRAIDRSDYRRAAALMERVREARAAYIKATRGELPQPATRH